MLMVWYTTPGEAAYIKANAYAKRKITSTPFERVHNVTVLVRTGTPPYSKLPVMMFVLLGAITECRTITVAGLLHQLLHSGA